MNQLLITLTLSLEMLLLSNLVAQSQPFTPTKKEIPDETAGAGSRNGLCIADENQENTQGFTAYIKNNAERPTFSVYIPETVAKNLIFSVKDTNEDYYYQTIIPIPETPGEFSFQLPANAPAMEANKEYTWFLGLICQEHLDPNDPLLQGVIQITVISH